MKILIVGNSQASCLKKAFEADGSLTASHDVAFYATPGGTGPYFRIEDRLPRVIEHLINPSFPPKWSAESVKTTPVDAYDAIVVSALGFVDGGFYYPSSSLTTRGALFDHRPKGDLPLVSEACYKAILSEEFQCQPGFAFLREVCSKFHGLVMVQPMPVMSEVVKSHLGWPLNQHYEDPLGAHSFFMQFRDDYLRQICAETKALLLPYPREDWRRALFAPHEFMNSTDGLHPSEGYGAMVLRQIIERL